MKKLILIGVLALAQLSAGVEALGAEYWPMVDGAVYTYESTGGGEMVATYGDSSRATAISYSAYPSYSSSWTYRIFSDVADGNLRMTSFSSMGYGGVDPDQWPFCPSIVFLDYPFTVGKSWSSLVYRCDGESWPIEISYQVLREETITVPLGTFDVFVVEETSAYSPSLGSTYYLNRELGPVRIGSFVLVTVTGTVGLEPLAWGSVKALYR